jgi:hypothetical protein
MVLAPYVVETFVYNTRRFTRACLAVSVGSVLACPLIVGRCVELHNVLFDLGLFSLLVWASDSRVDLILYSLVRHGK